MSLKNPHKKAEDKYEKLTGKDALIEKIVIAFFALALTGFFLKLLFL